MDNNRINGVWFGDALTNIQQLCIRSYSDHGHRFHLYIDNDRTTGIPSDAIVHSVAEILPNWRQDRKTFKCESHFSDYFRVMLIYKLGGWYVDLDTICLRHFDFDRDYVFVSENSFGAQRSTDLPTIPASCCKTKLINGCIFKAPQSSPFLKWIIDKIDVMDTLNAEWIAVGPQMFRDAVPHFGFQPYVEPPVTFDAVSPDELRHFVTGDIKWNINPASYTIHVRTSAWEPNDLDPNETYPESSLFEQLKRRHGV